MLKLEQFREICDNDPDPTKYAYSSLPGDSRRPGLPDGIPLRPIFVGIVQFTRDIYKERSESQLKTGRFRLADGSQSFSLSHLRTEYVVSRINQYR